MTSRFDGSVEAKPLFKARGEASMLAWSADASRVAFSSRRGDPLLGPVAGGDLAVALRRQGVDSEELVFPDEVHDFLIQSRWMQVFEKTADLLDRRMPAR